MSEPRESGPDAERPPEHHPHGLVEEIAEAVEHVPRPVRWTVTRLAWLVGLSLLGLIVVALVSGGLYLAHRTRWVAQELTLFVNQTLARRSDVVLEARDIQGNPLSGFTLIAPRLRFRAGEQPPLLEATRMRVGYSAWGLLGRGARTIDLTLEHPTLTLVRGADGRLRLPTWKTGPAGARGPAYRIHLRLRDASLRTPLPDVGVQGADLDLTLVTGPTRVTLGDLRWRLGPYGSRLERLAGDLALGDSVTFRVHELRSESLALSANGGWRSGTKEKSIHLDVARVRWRFLARMFHNHDLDVSGEGRVVLDARGERAWRGRFAADVVWDSLPGRVGGEFEWAGARLAVSPLALECPAGILSGRLSWSKAGWEVGGEARQADPRYWRVIHVQGWPAGDLNGSFRYAVDSRPGGSDRLDARLGASELSGWRADSGVVGVDFPAALPDSFTVRMTRRSGRVVLKGRSMASGWRGTWQAEQFPLEEWPDGRASGMRGLVSQGEGSVESRAGGLFATGTLSGVESDWLGMHIAAWRLEGLQGALLPKPDVFTNARLADVVYLGIHFDSASVALHVGDQAAALDHVRALAGDTLITAAGRCGWESSRWTLTLDRAAAESRQFHFTAAPPVSMHGDGKSVTFERLEARDGEAQLSIVGRWATAAGGTFDWRGRAERLDLSRIGLLPEGGVTGTAGATLEVHGVSGDPRWIFEARCDGPGARGHRADSLRLSLAGGPSRLEVRDFTCYLNGGTVAGSGRIEDTAQPFPDTLGGEAITRWLASGARWSGAFRAESLPLERLGELAPAARGVSGRLSGVLDVAGRPGSPELGVRAALEAPGWRDYRADRLSARASFRERRLEVPELRLVRGNVVSTASGMMPLDLALGRRAEIPEAPMSWKVEVPNGDLGLIPLIVPQIGAASGRFDLKAGLGGTARHPDLEGTIHVRDGAVRLAAREEVLEGVRADFHLDETRITLDTLTARQGARGRLRARGVVELSGLALKNYRFALTMRDFAAAEPGLYAAEFDGDFDVTNGPRVNGQTLPMVVGKATLHRAAILFDFANQSEVQQIAAQTQPLFWTYRVQVEATNNLHWRPPDGDIEFSADLSMEQTRDSLLIYGEMHALRGTHYFLSNRFTVSRADLSFDNIGGVNPTLDAEAVTRLTPTQEIEDPGSAPVAHQITVRIKGRANEPVIELEDDKHEWDEARMLRELTVGRFYDPSQRNLLANLGDPLDNYLTRAINRTLSEEMSRVFSNYVSEWSVERERGGILRGEGEVMIGATTQITPKLSLRYRQVVRGFGRDYTASGIIPNPLERDVEAEYRLNRFFYISTEVAQRRASIGTVTGSSATPDFNVNLKARWEY